MRNSLKGFLCSMAAVCLTILAAVSCTHVDDTLGQDFIPGGNDKLSLHIDTLGLGEGEAILEAEEYEYSNFYASGRLLENQSWDVWTFSPINYETEENILPIPRLLKAADNR